MKHHPKCENVWTAWTINISKTYYQISQLSLTYVLKRSI